MSESSSEQTEQSASTGDEGQQGIPDSALPEDVRPAEDNPLADPDHEIGGADEEEDEPGS